MTKKRLEKICSTVLVGVVSLAGFTLLVRVGSNIFANPYKIQGCLYNKSQEKYHTDDAGFLINLTDIDVHDPTNTQERFTVTKYQLHKTDCQVEMGKCYEFEVWDRYYGAFIMHERIIDSCRELGKK